MTDAAISVLLCDDHAVVREGLARMLAAAAGIEVVGSAADGADGVEETLRLRPDVVLMDISMPVLDGVEATRRIVAEAPGTRVVVLTSIPDDGRVLEAVDAGAIGYVFKDTEGSELVRAIRAAAAGGAPLDPRAARAVLERGSAVDPAAGMTAREREVLALIGAGLTNRAIATRLGISEATVKAHLTQIYRHIDVADRTQAAIWASENGLAGA